MFFPLGRSAETTPDGGYRDHLYPGPDALPADGSGAGTRLSRLVGKADVSRPCGMHRNDPESEGRGAFAHDLSRIALHSRSEEHTSELQSRENLVCRLLLAQQK